MLAAIVIQWIALALVAILALLVSGPIAGLSAMLGGMAAAVPNSLFAARLMLNRGRSPESYPVVFFLGEFIKIGLTVLLFGAVIAWDVEKHWLALAIGFIVALKAPLFALWYVPRAHVVPDHTSHASRHDPDGIAPVAVEHVGRPQTSQ